MSENETIVMTGAGLVSNLGLSRQETWDGILQGRCGMGPMTALEVPLPGGKDGGQAVDLPADFSPDLPREVRYLKWTIAAALSDAMLAGKLPYEPARCTALLGTTLHGMRAAGQYFRSNDLAALSTFLAGDTLQLALGDLPFAGLAATTCSACSSSLASVELGVTLLQTGKADLVIAGGYDTISEYVYGGFNSLRLVTDGPLRPFSKDRKGMKVAEGYGIVVLERARDAKKRGAKTIATILGWGESSDSHHLTQPHPSGEGAARAIRQALSRAALEPTYIDLVAAHATGTPDNDASEYAALASVFGDHLPNGPVIAYKSPLGHTLGGAGAVELILSAMAMRDQTVPACANITAEDAEFAALNLVLGTPRKAEIKATLNTSLGFGGSNTAVVLGLAPEVSTPAIHVPSRRGQDVFISGVGVVLPEIIGNEALVARLSATTPPPWDRLCGAISEESIIGLLNARRVRRMSDYVKLTLAAATLACRDAGIHDMAAFAEQCGAVLGTTHGSSNYSVAYYRQIVEEGIFSANPMLFAEAVPNGGAAHLSLMLGLKGSCQAVIGTRTAGLDALALATSRIRSGVWDRAIVGAGEELCDVVNNSYRPCGMLADTGGPPFVDDRGFVVGAGAVMFILESGESMAKRGHNPRGRIETTAGLRFSDRSQSAHAISAVLEEIKPANHLISSACRTWIDRAEAAGIRRAERPCTVSSIYGHIAETFSVGPLAGIAAVLLSGKLPRLLGEGGGSGTFANGGGVLAATGDENVESFATLCTDRTGCVAGAGIRRL